MNVPLSDRCLAMKCLYALFPRMLHRAYSKYQKISSCETLGRLDPMPKFWQTSLRFLEVLSQLFTEAIEGFSLFTRLLLLFISIRLFTIWTDVHAKTVCYHSNFRWRYFHAINECRYITTKRWHFFHTFFIMLIHVHTRFVQHCTKF